MKLANNTVLITGGGTGIGLAMAERFLAAGSEVIICGRRADVLEAANKKSPKLHKIVADVGTAAGRVALFEQVSREFPKLNVLVNNAGIQRRDPLTGGIGEWSEWHQEIAINLEAPIHLSLLFMPLLQKQANPAIINVTSGLAFTPLPIAAVYSATKAALHSFTLSLRTRAAKLGVEVIELVPPAVNTDLGGVGGHNHGVPLNEFSDAVMARIDAGEQEVGFGTSETRRRASRDELDEYLVQLAKLFP